MTAITPAGLAARIAAHHRPGAPLLVGITGPVAVGKTTLARQIAEALQPALSVAIVSTDGFLKSNAQLAAEGLEQRKGFPESYDSAGMAATLAALKRLPADGPVLVPAYSHAIYDVDPAAAQPVAAADVVLVEGLGLAPDAAGVRPPLDLLVYIDADEADVLGWYVERFVGLWAAAADDPGSFYARFRHLDEAGVRAFARQVWDAINGPNWHENIARARAVADLVVKKRPGHGLELIRS